MFTLVSQIVDIDPREAVTIGCGPFGLFRPDEKANLEANLVLLRDPHNFAVLVISVDALYIGPRLRHELEIRLSPYLEPRQILFAATHSHNAPQLDNTKPNLGMPVSSHLDMVLRRISDAAEQLVAQKGVHVEVRTRRYRVRTVVKRRWRRPFTILRTGISFFRVQSLPHPKKPRPTSEVLEFRDETGLLVAVIWVMPCHPTSLHNPAEFSSHFIGKIRSRIRDEQGSEKTAITFLQGASGDLRPPAFSRAKKDPMKCLLRVARGKEFGHFLPSDYEKWINRVYREYSTGKPLASWTLGHQTRSFLKADYIAMPLEALYLYKYDSPRFATCQVITISDLKLIAVSAEPTWGMRKRLLNSATQTTLIGCIDDAFGYFPSPREFRAGGYEATGFYEAFSLQNKARWEPLRIFEVLIRRALSAEDEKSKR